MEAASGMPVFAAKEIPVKYYYSKRNELVDQDRPFLDRQLLSNADSGSHAPLPCNGEFEVGAFYEIDHEKLPPKSPSQLKAIRVVKVSETTKLDVTVSFPSTLSLRSYFSTDPAGDCTPALDERFVMSSNQAGRILLRLVPSSQMQEEKHLESFWVLNPKVVDESTPVLVSTTIMEEDVKTPVMGDCLSSLKIAGVVGWGIRRKVKYIGRHREIPSPEKKVEEEEGEEEVPQQIGEKRKREAVRKRKWKKRRDDTERKKPKREKVTVRRNQGNRDKNSRDRWSTERYEAAEMKLLGIMKEKGAVLGSPILRQELREEARKHIGDTGLLDHLLKHMAGKTVTEGGERFRRRHNSEGAMEYWLEAADLVEIRRKAGVVDPYWAPPPGWKLGDSTSPCPCGNECLRETSKLKEEVATLKRDLEQLVYLKQLEKEAKDTQSEANTAFNFQEKYESLLKWNRKLEEEMSGMSSSLQGLKEEMRVLKEEKEKREEMKKVVDQVMEEEKERSKVAAAEEKVMIKGKMRENKKCTSEEEDDNNNNNSKNSSTSNIGGMKVVRRSGFRICKPQGTFLWPDMGNTSTSTCPSSAAAATADGRGGMLMSPSPRPHGLMVPTTTIEDHLMLFRGGAGGGVLTPTSASSATSPPKFFLPAPSSPVLPRATAGMLMVPPPHLQQQQILSERTASSENFCSAFYYHMARVSSASLIGGDPGKKEVLRETEYVRSSITTDLALATPSSSSLYR